MGIFIHTPAVSNETPIEVGSIRRT